MAGKKISSYVDINTPSMNDDSINVSPDSFVEVTLDDNTTHTIIGSALHSLKRLLNELNPANFSISITPSTTLIITDEIASAILATLVRRIRKVRKLNNNGQFVAAFAELEILLLAMALNTHWMYVEDKAVLIAFLKRWSNLWMAAIYGLKKKKEMKDVSINAVVRVFIGVHNGLMKYSNIDILVPIVKRMRQASNYAMNATK